MKSYIGWVQKDPECGLRYPRSWGVPPSRNVGVFTSSESPVLGTFIEASSCRCDQLFTHFLAPLLSLEDGHRAECSKLLTTVWSFP